MLKELWYEWILLMANFWGGDFNRRGFFDNYNLYEKNGWLDWNVTHINQKVKEC